MITVIATRSSKVHHGDSFAIHESRILHEVIGQTSRYIVTFDQTHRSYVCSTRKTAERLLRQGDDT